MDKEQNLQESIEPQIDPTQSSTPYDQDNYQSVNANTMLEEYYKFKETINKLLQVIRKSELSAVEKLEQIKDAIQRISVVALYSSYGSSQNSIEESLHQSVQQSSMEAINPIIFQLKNNMHNLRLENEELKENIVKMQKLKQEEISKMKEELQRMRMETKNKQVLSTIMQDSIGEELSKIKKRMSKQDPQIIPQQIAVSQIIQTQKTFPYDETANLQKQIIQKAKQIQDLNLLNQQIQRQLSQLTEEINNNKQRFQQRSQEGQLLIRQLQQKLQLKERRLLEITQENSKFKIQINSLIDEIGLKGVALYDARNQLQSKKRQIVQLQQELKKKAHLVEPNQKELQTLKAQILSLKANQKQSALRYQQLSKNITSQSQQYSKTREVFLQDISKLKIQLQIQSQSSKKLQETIDNLVAKNESLRRQIVEVKKQEQEHLPSKEELFRYISKMGRAIATKEGRLNFKQELNMMVSSIK